MTEGQYHRSEISNAEHELVSEARGAMQHSPTVTEHLLESVDKFRRQGVLGEVANALQDNSEAYVQRRNNDPKGEPISIYFPRDPEHGDWGPALHVDLKDDPANSTHEDIVDGHSLSEIHKERVDEALRFIDAKVDSSTRPLPTQWEKTPLNGQQREMLRTLEKGLVSGDLASIKQAFQDNPDITSWKRVVKDLDLVDMPAVSMVDIGKSPDGQPYMALRPSPMVHEDQGDAIVIPSSGDIKMVGRDEYGKVIWGKAPRFTDAAADTMKNISAWNLYQATEGYQGLEPIRTDFKEKHAGQRMDSNLSIDEIIKFHNERMYELNHPSKQ
jgi:hypothetical protein